MGILSDFAHMTEKIVTNQDSYRRKQQNSEHLLKKIKKSIVSKCQDSLFVINDQNY